MVRRLGHGLLSLGGWELHSYGKTRETLEGRLDPPSESPEEAVMHPRLPLPVSGVEVFVGSVDENDRGELSRRLTEHLLLSPEELNAAGRPAIDLVYMNPKSLISRMRHDSGYINIMEAAIESDKIVIAKMRHIDPVLDWLRKDRPIDHEVSIEFLQQAARQEIACYTGAAD